MKNKKEHPQNQPSTEVKLSKEDLSKMSREEVLKVIFDRPVEKIKESGHAKYAR